MEEKAQNNQARKKVNRKSNQTKRTKSRLFKLFFNIHGDYRQIDFDIFQDAPDLKKKLFDIALNNILDTVGTKKDHIEICEINDSGYVVCVHKDEWKPLLEKVKDSYIKSERYEDCTHIQKLIDSL